MKRNISAAERLARIIIGVVLITLAFVGPASPWFLLGLIPLATGLVGWCPLYAALGIHTAERSA